MTQSMPSRQYSLPQQSVLNAVFNQERHQFSGPSTAYSAVLKGNFDLEDFKTQGLGGIEKRSVFQHPTVESLRITNK